VAVGAGFHLNAGQGAEILILTMVVAAVYAAADILVCLLHAHFIHLIKRFTVSGEVYSARAQADYAFSFRDRPF
jgi:hypothetical protein